MTMIIWVKGSGYQVRVWPIPLTSLIAAITTNKVGWIFHRVQCKTTPNKEEQTIVLQ